MSKPVRSALYREAAEGLLEQVHLSAQEGHFVAKTVINRLVCQNCKLADGLGAVAFDDLKNLDPVADQMRGDCDAQDPAAFLFGIGCKADPIKPGVCPASTRRSTAD